MGNGEKTPEKGAKSRLDTIEETVTELIDTLAGLATRLDQVEKTTVKKKAGLFGGKRERIAIKDTKTGIVYVSKAAVGKAVATEADTSPEDHFAWYKLQAKFPDRFVEASAEEKTKAVEDEKVEIEKWKKEHDAELAADAAKKAPKS